MDLIGKAQFSDFRVQIGNQEYKLHKLILSRIPYFANHFTNNPASRKLSLEISAHLFETIIKWTYSKSPQQLENADIVPIISLAKQLGIDEIVTVLAAKASVISECFLHIFNSDCLDVFDWKTIRKTCKLNMDNLISIFPSIKNLEVANKVLTICNHESMSDVIIMASKWEEAHKGNKDIWKAIAGLELAIHPKQILLISMHDPMLLSKYEVYSKLANMMPLQDGDKLVYKYQIHYDENGVSGRLEDNDFQFDSSQIVVIVTSEHIKVQVSQEYNLKENSVLTVTNIVNNHSLYRWIKPGETYSFHLVVGSVKSYSLRIYEKKI